jgi:hypothetical protein
MNQNVFAIGDTFDFNGEISEGIALGFGGNGIHMTIYMEDMTKEEIHGCRSPIDKVALFDPDDHLPMCFFCINFKSEYFGPFDTAFDANEFVTQSPNSKQSLDFFLYTQTNILSFYTVNNLVLTNIRVVGLDFGIVTHLKNNIKKQLAIKKYSETSFRNQGMKFQSIYTTKQMIQNAILIQQF